VFTGLIEAIGTVRAQRAAAGGARLAVAASFARELEVGESVAVDGVCLTIVSVSGDVFELDVSGETLARTTLRDLRSGARVNLERALALGDRLGGHMVSGHVDGTGRISRHARRGDYEEVVIEPSGQLPGSIVLKGSIAIDGISLTVSAVDGAAFLVTLIPQTMRSATLGAKGVGAEVNIETDLIGKYVEEYLAKAQRGPQEVPSGGLGQLLDVSIEEGG